MTVTIKRGFVDIAEGQVHYREIQGGADGGRLPLVLLHSSHLSSLLMVKLAECFALTRDVIALDTLGQGDSCPPATDDASISYFAGAQMRALDGLGGKYRHFDVFGTHTGARIAADMAIDFPDRVHAVILDGMRRMPGGLYDEYAIKIDMSRHIDPDGTQFFKAWNKWRDEYVFRPPHRWDVEQLTRSPLPSAYDMHDAAVEVFKGIPHAHIAYRAAIFYRPQERLPLITQPAMCTCGERDGSFVDIDYSASLIPGAIARPHPGPDRVEHSSPEGLAALAKMVTDWLDRLPARA
jgi:pimeloyl-ACP methyl ester carboxylesterase